MRAAKLSEQLQVAKLNKSFLEAASVAEQAIKWLFVYEEMFRSKTLAKGKGRKNPDLAFVGDDGIK